MRSLVLAFLNNVVINNILIVLKRDHFIKRFKANWANVRMDHSKSLQENVGFSHAPEVQDAIDRVHLKLHELNQQNQFHSVLDIGCGTGLYLEKFKQLDIIHGTDLSNEFLSEAKRLIPHGTFFCQDYLKLSLPVQYDLIFSISVLEYIEPSRLTQFFEKIHSDLNVNGLLFIEYPHALRRMDTFYPDLSYVNYSPRKIEKILSKNFEIILHSHLLDNRKADFIFDSVRYDPEKEKSFRNGVILIAKKK